jgi:release factor glutamine methyltransferase
LPQFDLIVSNPPYIAEGDPHLRALRHEPLTALVAADGGLAAIHRILDGAPDHVTPGGWLLLEHGHDQGPAVAFEFERRGWVRVGRRHDLGGRWRCTGGQRPPTSEPDQPQHVACHFQGSCD